MLSGRKILEWTERVEGAFCARILADLGAEVIKIEHPGAGDPIRREGPIAPGSASGESALFGYLNHGKRSITLDPRSGSGAALFELLVGKCDLLIESELSARSPDAAAIAQLRDRHRNLAVLSFSPVGIGVPSDRWPHTPLTLQHYSGYALHQALPVAKPAMQPPVGCAEREASLVVGVSGAAAAMWALLVADDAPRAPHVNMSAHDFYAAHVYPGPLAEWCEGEREFKRARSSFGGTEVAGGLVWLLQCADGWFMVSPREQHQWGRWVEVMGSPGWAQDSALCGDRNARRKNYVELQRLMSQWTGDKTRQFAFAAARAARVAGFPVNDAADLLGNDQLRARNFFNQLRCSDGRLLPIPGLPFTVTTPSGQWPRALVVTAPGLGEANDEVFGNRLGLTADELEPLRAGRIV